MNPSRRASLLESAGMPLSAIHNWLEYHARGADVGNERLKTENRLFALLRSPAAKRIPPQVRKDIRVAVGEKAYKDAKRKEDFVPYEKPRAKVGAVNGVFYCSHNELGEFGKPVCCIIRPGEGKGESAKGLEAGFHAAKQACAAELQRALGGMGVFDVEALDKYNFEIEDGANVSLNYTGESVGLPLAIALFSEVTDLPVPLTALFSGTLDPDGGLRWTAELNTKLQGALSEFPFITDVYLPRESSLGKVRSSVRIQKLGALRDVLKRVFRNWERKISRIDIKGAIQMRWIPASHKHRTLLELRVAHDNSIPAKVLAKIDVERTLPGKEAGIVIDGARPGWLVSALVAELKNTANFVAVYDPKLPAPAKTSSQASQKHAVVVVAPKDGTLKRGEIISYVATGKRV